MTKEEFFQKCDSTLSWYGFSKQDDNNYIIEQVQQQQLIININGKSSVASGPKTIVNIIFDEGSCEILDDGTEIPMVNINIKVNNNDNCFIMKYDDYDWFEDLIKQILR